MVLSRRRTTDCDFDRNLSRNQLAWQTTRNRRKPHAAVLVGPQLGKLSANVPVLAATSQRPLAGAAAAPPVRLAGVAANLLPVLVRGRLMREFMWLTP